MSASTARPQQARRRTAYVEGVGATEAGDGWGDLLPHDARTRRAPQGEAACPVCGTSLALTRDGAIRAHGVGRRRKVRCEASGRAWKDYGRRRARPRAGQDLRGERG